MKKPSQKLIHSKRKSRFSLLEKIYGTFAVILVFTFFSAYASFQSAQRTTLASHWVDHTYRVLWHLDHFYSALQAATSHQRAYLLTNQKIFLIRYHHSAEVVMRSLRQLGPMIADNPIEQGNLTLLQKAVAKRLNASDTLIKESSHHISNATRMAKMQKGLNAMAEIRNTVANMETEEGGLLKSRLASEERRARKLRIALSVEILLTILFLAFSLWIISRQISNNQYFQMEKERLENEIISMMTHELRNPLTVIYSALTALADHYSKNPSSEQNRFLDIATKSSRRMQRLIEDFLEIQKLEYGAISFNIRTVELSPLIREVLESNQAYSNRRKVTLVLVTDLPNSFVKVDPDRLAQVLSNLISNGVKHSSSKAQVEIGISRHGSMLRVHVKDHGPGIPDAFRQEIFKKFSREANEIYKDGSGLGLSISKAIIEKMGGTIQLGQDQNGATFYFDLPEVHL